MEILHFGTKEWLAIDPTTTWKKVAFQGVKGAYAHMALARLCPQAEPVSYMTFADALRSVEEGVNDGVILPVENSTMGCIQDSHALLPHTHLHLVGEHYLPVNHCLLAVKGATLSSVKHVYSQLPAIQQCRATLTLLGVESRAFSDTAGAAAMVAEKGDLTIAALASKFAGEVYGLDVLRENMNDYADNTTRFHLYGARGWRPDPAIGCKTTVFFQVKDVPSALYKTLGGFATNGVNITRLESALTKGEFRLAEFFVDIEGSPEELPVNRALQELAFFSAKMRVIGIYPAKGVVTRDELPN